MHSLILSILLTLLPAAAWAGSNIGEVTVSTATPIDVTCVGGCAGSVGESTTTIRGSGGVLADVTATGRLKVESTQASGSTSTVMIVGSQGLNLITVDSSGRLLVRDSATAPPDTTSVSTSAFSLITKDDIENTIYTVTAGSTLTIQTVSFACPNIGLAKYVRITIYEDPNGDLSVLNRKYTGYCSGENFVRALDLEFVGDGTNRIVLQAEAFGVSMEIFRRWAGFETP